MANTSNFSGLISKVSAMINNRFEWYGRLQIDPILSADKKRLFKPEETIHHISGAGGIVNSYNLNNIPGFILASNFLFTPSVQIE